MSSTFSQIAYRTWINKLCSLNSSSRQQVQCKWESQTAEVNLKQMRWCGMLTVSNFQIQE